ncbi:hypothetical protein L1280_001925 [Deinococcus sp. HSC-46F16]|uniref:hypothetical protein n=1 Tax=Deinococcus sp. HSC-46F16 TaxID=2910968 RepID=UPI00209E9C0E|nr:hypothetical protein [Deinococcus sp. HSC-46F16]MCP2014773.1 hypothetical protein [Deinococcus sp. HSC-46F16]
MDRDFEAAYRSCLNRVTRTPFRQDNSRRNGPVEEYLRLRELYDEQAIIDDGSLYRIEQVLLLRALRGVEMSVEDLRDDATLFILTNLKFMAVNPLLAVYNQRDGADSRLFGSFIVIEADLSRVLLAAREERRGRRVSSSSLFRVGGELWEDLRSNAMNMWGDDD